MDLNLRSVYLWGESGSDVGCDGRQNCFVWLRFYDLKSLLVRELKTQTYMLKTADRGPFFMGVRQVGSPVKGPHSTYNE